LRSYIIKKKITEILLMILSSRFMCELGIDCLDFYDQEAILPLLHQVDINNVNSCNNVNNYILSELLMDSRDGTLQIYSAFSKTRRENVALKIIDTKNSSVTKLHQFQNELMIKEMIDSRQPPPYFPTTYDYFKLKHSHQEYDYLVMELADTDLFKVIEASGKLSELLAKVYFEQIVRALDWLHRNSISHGDIKLDNILLKDGQILLTDFGLSSYFRNGQTKSSFCGGTSLYLSPEMVHAHLAPKCSSTHCALKNDMWALGVTLYALLHGYMPYDEDHDILSVNWRPKLSSDLSLLAQNLIERLLQLDPLGRPSIVELLQDPWLH